MEGFTGGQQSIVHLVSTVQEATLRFVFTDGHGIIEWTEFHDDLAQLEEVDWPLMEEHYWFDTHDYPDRKRRRQAEFLVHGRFPIGLIRGIGVIDQQKKAKTERLLASFRLAIPVATKPGWYY
uniref:DarT domain-containing protein n=1 Tax=Candidatus Kentrum sp. TUN TaxID=2126343 RepID=A0A450ZGY4_9GAMM|nr:MAG: protein of unknown function (DUF4433) [Candidatus Kentron sp. TUN]